jgi:hemerythrin-like domain-containing protein
MSFRYRINQVMHDEHMAASAMLRDVESLLAGAGRNPPDTTVAAIAATLTKAADALEGEVREHFDFEEETLFPLLAEHDEAEIGEHLTEDHRIILPLAEDVIAGSRGALASGFSDQGWNAFRTAAAELVERLSAHIDKEEMALLPKLEDALDPETDLAFFERHGNRD